MIASFQKPAGVAAIGRRVNLTRAYNYFTQPNIISQALSKYANSLRREFEMSSVIRSTFARIWARSAPNYTAAFG